jgi:hypothetical protein
MAKPVVKATKGYREGHISLSVKADAHHFGVSVASTVSVALDIDAARVLQAEIGDAVTKAEAKMKAHADREARRKAWRDREVAAGRMKIIPACEFFRK